MDQVKPCSRAPVGHYLCSLPNGSQKRTPGNVQCKRQVTRCLVTCRFPVGVAGFEPAASSSRSQVVVSTASAASCLTWERPSVDVRWRPPLAVAIVTHLVTRPPAGFSLAIWMQTTGAALLAVKRCSLVRVPMVAQDRHGTYGLLYLAAVQHSKIRRLCHAHPLPAHSDADLPKCCSLVSSRQQR
jgi:hypothetical protein